ncbi:MAG: formate dehydrogenase accessory sulfurtransferase FdhD [Methanoregula sp.]|jgi:FdhD protein|nr:formate dehydrogenase accessory sulfurtransferase FdhD [Methanoregula sp.]
MKQKKTPKNENSIKTDKESQPSPMYRSLPCIRVDGDLFEHSADDVVEEIPIALFVNGRHAITAVMSPVNLEDFVTGYLFTEEIIKTIKEIESIKIEKNRVSVITKNLFKVLPPKKTILSGCGGSVSFIDVEKLPKIHSDFSISAAALTAALQSVLDSDIHRTTGAFYRVVLLDSQRVVSVAEDIGRHNAIDRIIGYSLRNGIYMSQTFVISSGRISSEMVRKCLIANIPIIVSLGATTTLSVDIADKTGMTVIGFARDGKMNIYSHPERITGNRLK